MSRIIGLGDMYDLWIKGKSKKLAQVMSRALDDQVREEWQAIISEVNDWEQANMKTVFIPLESFPEVDARRRRRNGTISNADRGGHFRKRKGGRIF